MKATIKDIAAYCHVSEGTVDRALNNRYGIGEKTKRRILEAASELNYQPNHAGRSLATGLTMTIGIVCFDLYNNFFPELIDTIESEAKQRGYFIHLILTHMEQPEGAPGPRIPVSPGRGWHHPVSHRRWRGVYRLPERPGCSHCHGVQLALAGFFPCGRRQFPRDAGCGGLALCERVRARDVHDPRDRAAGRAGRSNVFTIKQRLLGYMEGVQSARRGI